jgi:hypothetical protein
MSEIRVEFEPESKRIKLENMNTENEHNEDMFIDDILSEVLILFLVYQPILIYISTRFVL